ncbi:recombinase family protein [Catenulispora sp. NF23]|uniref:recombinase family protein n=1 Tax=Catenulispora pinistramenti TaxID=2705254 RepID=UPI001BA6E582|nr:recombinase family protein [Catenulispora pinistramenti]MBS2532166.1 recombinase family protein [Catenulispora pinistramenti]
MAGPRRGERGALYCCVPHRTDADQLPVDAQERQGRALAASLCITVRPESVFADRQRAVWQPETDRTGWTNLLAAIRAGRARAALVFRPSTLIRHRPADAVELLLLAEERRVALHGFGDDVDLSDPGVRSAVLDRARQSSQTASALSEAARAAHEVAAATGRPHGGGRRAYGYEPGMRALIPEESRVVREVYARYLDGESLRAIAWDLNARGVPTSTGSTWTTTGVDRILLAPRYCGLRVFRGSVDREEGGLRPGRWEACVDIGDWRRAQKERAGRAAANSAGRRQRARYLLTGLVMCGRCHVHMVGSIVGEYRMYACASLNSPLPRTCTMHIAAASLEDFVCEAAVGLLLDGNDSMIDPDRPVSVRRGPAGPPAGRDGFRAGHGQIDLRDVHALDGVVTGPKAPAAWRRLPEERRAAVLRALFTAVEIGPKTTAHGVFDTSRITLVQSRDPGISMP